ncbi:MAG: hypothetical protein HY074_15000, partial [Deltaproteobacteria bacterium]|nr:hypothetical protein [Deltaproteobacteria bacterium]
MCKPIFSILALLIATQTFATEEVMRIYKGVRSLGMGGVVTTTGRYDEALFANPATQLEDENWKLSILSVTGEVNAHFVSDASKVSAVKSAQGSDAIQKISDSGLVGRNEHTRVSILAPGFYSPHFFGENTSLAFGLLIDEQTDLMLRGNADVDAQALVNIGPNLGVGHKFLDGALDVGLNTHVLYRLSGDPTLNATAFLAGQKLTLNSIAGQGIGLDFDLGAYYTIPWSNGILKKVAVGASLNSLMQSTYRIAGSTIIKTVTGSPFGNDRTASLGVRTDLPDFLVTSNTLFAIEFQDIGTTRRLASFWKKLHFGAETHLLVKMLSVRAGFNEGYL